MSEKPTSPLRQRMLDDMNMRRFTPDRRADFDLFEDRGHAFARDKHFLYACRLRMLPALLLFRVERRNIIGEGF
jgi:hypothetical protein